MEIILSNLVFFFAVIDPIGSVPVFIAVTQHLSTKQKIQTAIKATIIAFCVLIFFAVAGEVIFTAIEIPLSAFQIAGGIILLFLPNLVSDDFVHYFYASLKQSNGHYILNESAPLPTISDKTKNKRQCR